MLWKAPRWVVERSSLLMSANVFAVIAIVILTTFALSHSVRAAGFDCNSAATKTEIIICSDDELSSLDTELSQIYNNLPQDALFHPMLIEDQRVWLERRDRMFEENADQQDLKDSYKDRIVFLWLYDDYIARCEAVDLGLYASGYRGTDECTLDHPVDNCRQSLMMENTPTMGTGWRASDALEICGAQWTLIERFTLRTLEEALFEKLQPNASVESLEEFEVYLQSRRDFISSALSVDELVVVQNLDIPQSFSNWFFEGYYRELIGMYQAALASER